MKDLVTLPTTELAADIRAALPDDCNPLSIEGIAHTCIDELCRRAPLYQELRDALVWFGDSQVTDGGLPPFSEIYDHDTEPHITAYSPEKGEHYADFLVRVHRIIAAKSPPPILSDSSGGAT